MPNWVRHSVLVEGPEEDQIKMKEFVKTKDEKISFEKIIPMPKELKIDSGSASYRSYGDKEDVQIERLLNLTDEYLKYTQKQYVQKVTTELKPVARKITELKCPAKMKNEELDKKYREETLSTLLKGYWNYKKFGYTDWYNWSIRNWGTKWDACDSEWYGDELMFSTAWSTCQPVFEKLSELFPTLSFEITYCDEDMYGGNSGCYGYENGEFAEKSKDLSDIISETWGPSFLEEDGDCDEDENDDNYDEDDDSEEARFERKDGLSKE